MRHRRRISRRLEHLETRRLLAGDLQIAFAGVADDSSSPTNSGLVLSVNTVTGEVAPLDNSFLTSDIGISGAALLTDGRLFVATGDSSGSPSSLLEISPVTGNAVGASQELSVRILDLAADRAGGDAFALVDVGGNLSTLHRVDLDSGTTTQLGALSLFMAGGLAVDDTGQAIVTAIDASTGDAVLHHIDTNVGTTTATISIGDHLEFSGHFSGLGFRGDGLLIGSDAESGMLFSVDPDDGEVGAVALQRPVHGVIGDLAFGADECTIDQVYVEDFENGPGDYVVDNSGSTIPGLWHHSPGRRFDGKLNHSPIYSFYYGAFETAFGGGHYVLTEPHRGTITSPPIQLPSSGTSILSFSYLLDTRPELDRDFVSVSIIDGGDVIEILSRQDGSLPQTGRQKWLTATHDVSQFNGKEIQVQFLFDTGAIPRIDPEGWYVDDVRITNKAADADLSVLKSVDDTTPNEDQTVTFTIDVTNQAASSLAATNVVVRDVLPTGVTFVDATPTASFDPASRTVTWNASSIAIGESATFSITASVDSGTAGAVLENVVTVSADEPDPDPSNNTDQSQFVVNSVDLAAVKSVDDPTPIEGQQVTFTIDVTNSASSNAAATSVVVQDTLPAGVTFIDASPAASFDLQANTVTWNVDSIAIGGGETFTITARIDGGTAGQVLQNLAVTAAEETDPDPTNNTSSTTVDVQPLPMQTVQFITPLSVFRDGEFVIPADQQIAILGRVWVDGNDNGVWDDGEAGLDGADIVLTRGNEQTRFARSRAVDLNGDGVIDPVNERGIYWFQQRGDLTAGTYTVAIEPPDGADTSFPVGSTQHTITLDSANPSLIAGAVQTVAPNFGLQSDFVASPPTGRTSIIGHSWADLDQDGVWDAGEPGRYGFEYFLDLDGNGSFDPETEVSTITGEDGKYVFANIVPGTYTIVERSSRATESLQTFPDGSAHTITVAAGDVVEGAFGQTEAPNIGVFEYGVFVRPADQILARMNTTGLQPALVPWQGFSISNTTGAEFAITEISPAAISGSAAEFVTTRQIAADGTLVEPVFPLAVANGETAQFLAFYDPAIRVGDEVISQSPDWLGTLTPVHTFAADDQLSVITDTGLAFPIRLVGGSTFDSDISYDGLVDIEDFRLLDDRLLLERVIQEGDSPRFDPTSDVNARCPNGADQVSGTCAFPIGTIPNREIAFGDFGPMNVELGLSRDPLPSPAPPDALRLIDVEPAVSRAVIAPVSTAEGEVVAGFEPLEPCGPKAVNQVAMFEAIAAPSDDDDWAAQIDELFRQMGPVDWQL